MNELSPLDFIDNYKARLISTLSEADLSGISFLAQDMESCWRSGKHVYICGNGGSAGNAIHIANDFVYGIAKKTGEGLKTTALSANQAVLTCLANDIDYSDIYSEQVALFAQQGDILIVLSGSGNSPNIRKAIEQAKSMGIKTYGVFGYYGGECKDLVDVPIHFEVNDMQISEDLQLIVFHMIMQWLYKRKDLMKK